MKRSKFLKLSLALPLAPDFISGSRLLSPDRSKKGFAVTNGKDRFDQAISLLEGDMFFTKISSKDTNGDLYTFESTRVKNGGPTLHTHKDQDEWWYILEGEFKVKVGDEIYETKAGDSVFGPRGVPHTFTKTGEGTARMIISFQPAGKMEDFFTAISAGAMKGKSEKEQDDFRKAHGFERVGPPLEYFKKF
ncbi:cupin domain-containing protein [Dyadobacter arcticus]|uniref:Mannose-6-phosphate isomerase-like protein (Cupin superfamily) n=1 Tax=Dyadobacter arcticus TaxID=1078754 RepID=A0ABX0UN71_9BACT|nr:cupin domain-containing protein [Dyadobacter arcticus]NIJ54327.1 mannose-6-phosphate isomerase-like protein (cupin superfamily) [Dyadobacter arcticus]